MSCVLGGGIPQARATTGMPEGLEEPKVFVKPADGYPFLGRFYVSSVSRESSILGGVLDVKVWTEGEPPFMLGELQLRTHGPTGTLENVRVQLFPWSYQHERLHADIIQVGSGSPEHPFGIKIGSLSFADPARVHFVGRLEREARRITKGRLTLDGRGPEKITFVRTSTDGLVHIPPAKRLGK